MLELRAGALCTNGVPEAQGGARARIRCIRRRPSRRSRRPRHQHSALHMDWMHVVHTALDECMAFARAPSQRRSRPGPVGCDRGAWRAPGCIDGAHSPHLFAHLFARVPPRRPVRTRGSLNS